MQMNITLTVDTDDLTSVQDSHLHALWHAAQANPVPMEDRDAGDLVQAITFEIVRRWLKQAPVELYHHQPTNHYWHTLQRHGNWRGPGATWLPHDRTPAAPCADACTASPTTTPEQGA